ncbi:MAG: hypothetical protein RL522_2245 [Pseudomonadota bacterium]|jgi:hypothetical protein
MTLTPQDTTFLDALRQATAARQAATLGTAAFCERVRALHLPPALPPAFGQVLADLLDRMESSALFSGESCSFSEADLDAALQTWIERAQARLRQS